MSCALPALANGSRNAVAAAGTPSTKDQMCAEMLNLDQQARTARTAGNTTQALEYERRFARLQAALGGDDPRKGHTATSTLVAPVAQGGAAQLVTNVCGGGATATASASNAPGLAINDLSTVSDSIVVSGAPTVIWDLDVFLNITHTYPADLDITLQSPAGTIATISTDNGGTSDDAFAGTLFDDSATFSAEDFAYSVGVAAASVTSETPLSRFRGENPNGTWTITITDDANIDIGNFASWRLDYTTIGALPAAGVPVNYANATSQPIPDVSAISSQIVVSGAGAQISDVNLNLFVQHTYNADLDITLQSPAGTIITISTDCGGGNDDVFSATTFDDSASSTVLDYAYVDLTAAPLLSPETPFDRLIGEDPNGTWTLTIIDDLGQDTGTLNSWSLDIATCNGSGTAFCAGDGTFLDHTAACPCGNNGATGNGCAHSFNPAGANITATGSVPADDIVLASSGEPATSFTLFLQHSAAGDTVFHDGTLCAGGTLIRLRGRAAVGGQAFFPNSVFPQDQTITLSQRGGVFPGMGVRRYYSAWFRNASTSFCPPATANVTNGWYIDW